MMKDQAEKEAEELLPCQWVTNHGADQCRDGDKLCLMCAKRPAVGEALRKRDEEIDRLQQDIKQIIAPIEVGGGIVANLQSQLAAANIENERLIGKTVVAGGLAITLADHVKRCEVLIADEQAKINPDNSVIGALCDSVRLVREYVDSVPVKVSQLRTEITQLQDQLKAFKDLRVWNVNGHYSLRDAIDGDPPSKEQWEALGNVLEAQLKARLKEAGHE